MNDFWIDCYFKECCMARNFSRFAQRYAILGQRIARDNFVKGTVALDPRDFWPSVFFSSINPVWSLINRL
jgi:hypothetical protein